MKKLLLLSLTVFSFGVYSDISSDKIAEIEQRVSSMGIKELQDRRSYLINEESSLSNQLDTTQNPSTNKAMSERLASIRAELSAIQKALLAAIGAGVIASVTDDGYDDNVPPVITVIGDNPATVELGDTYTDQGASAFDEFHGVTQVTSSGTVDTSTVGTYTITYSATDLDGNSASATRTVNVVDTTAPVVTVTGDNPATVELGGTYTDAGATATDASGAVTAVASGTVDTTTVGSYVITYTSTDASGNSGTATRTVNVVDTTAPVVTVTGDNPATVELGGTYTDAGATATDASGAVTVVTSGDTVDPDTLGTYTITYTSTDASGNAGTATRTVNVVDTTAPVFTSSSTFVVDEGDTAVGTATATDIQAVTFTISGTVLEITSAGVITFIAPADYEGSYISEDPSKLEYAGPESFTATVTATDASSNAATQVITVSIRDSGGIDDNNATGTGTGTTLSLIHI